MKPSNVSSFDNAQAKALKSGGSAIKRLKKTFKAAGVYEKLQKVSKKASQNSTGKRLELRKEGKELLTRIAKKSLHNNPFEQRFQPQKHAVLNRVIKGAKGRPGQVRARHEQVRQDSLGIELKNKKRENVMIDKRFGENDPNMSAEDKMLERFMREKTKKLQSGALFNLEEEEELTHMGQSLSGFDDAGLEAVDAGEESDGNIDASIVKFTHFGGFDEGNDPNAKKTRNEIMKEVIAKSKMHKRERQVQKEHDLDLTEQVDADLDEIKGLLAPMSAPPKVASEGRMTVSADRLKLLEGDTAEEKSRVDHDQDYDRFLRELAYEKRAKASDRIKSEEELAIEAKEELESSEAARIRRMNGVVDDEEKESKRAKKKVEKVDRPTQADDLGDEEYRTDLNERLEQEDVKPLTYKDGVLVNNKIFMKQKEEDSSQEETRDSESESEDENSEEDEDDEEVNSEEEESEQEQLNVKAKSSSDSLEPDFEALTSDLDDEEEFSDGEELVDDQAALEDLYEEDDEDNEVEKPKKRRKISETMKEAAKELPFTFEAPNSLNAFMDLIANRSSEDQIVIVKRLRVLYNAKLSSENKGKMEALTHILAERVVQLGSEQPVDIELISKYQEHYVELARQLPVGFAKWCRTKIGSTRDAFNKAMAYPSKKLELLPPGNLILLMDLARIYSCSDLHHSVITPAMLLMGQILGQAPIHNFNDAYSGIFLCHVFHMYTAESKRYVPEVVNYLHLILTQLMKGCKGLKVPKTLSTLRKCTTELAITDFTQPCADLSYSIIFGDEICKLDDPSRLFLLSECIALLTKLCKLYNDTTCIVEVFESTMSILSLIPSGANPQILELLTQARRIINPLLEGAKLKRRPLQLQKRKAMAIKSYVPKFHATYSIDKRYDPDRDRAEDSKNRAEYKKEFKGAVRELRKDAAFLARAKIDKIKESDASYKKKMDHIRGELSMQEGAMRGYEKLNNKAKGKKRS